VSAKKTLSIKENKLFWLIKSLHFNDGRPNTVLVQTFQEAIEYIGKNMDLIKTMESSLIWIFLNTASV
jgi:hypothetical protein